MNYNKDLYQIIKIDKNASQELVNQKCRELVKKDVADEIGIAALVLSNPQKREEYDRVGWKEEWKRDWEQEREFRHSIFEAIQNYKHHYGNTYALKPDDFRVYVWPKEHLDPSLWAPASGWVNKIWSIRGPNYQSELESFKNKMLVALDEAWEKEEKTPLLNECWEAASGNCAECGKTAKLRRKGKHSDGQVYCSRECYWEKKFEIPRYEFEKPKEFKFEILQPKLKKIKPWCAKCGYQGYDCYKMSDEVYRCKSCFNEYLEDLKKFPRKDKQIPNKNKLDKYKCSECGKKYDGAGYGVNDSDGNTYNYCSKACQEKHKPGSYKVSPIIRELEEFLKKKNPHQEEITKTEYNRLTGKTTTKKVKWNPLHELLKWMKREGITNISLNSQGNLVIEYGSRSTTLKDNELTNEQKEIKEFFQTVGQTQLSRNELEQAVNEQGQEGKKPKNDWVLPVVIGGAVVLIIILIGTVIYYRNKARRGY